MTSVEERLAALEHELERLRAVQDVANLMGRYTVNHTPATMRDHVELFALELPDVSVEVGDRGVYVGEAGVRELYQGHFPMDPRGNLLVHYLATPMVEVAADGLSARGVWRSPGVEAVRSDGGHPVALWSFGSYAADFVKIDGRWKIHHLQWFRAIKCTFEDGWVEDLSMTFSAPLGTSENLRPTTYHNPYTPESVQEPVPGCPPAYTTAEGFSWAQRAQQVP